MATNKKLGRGMGSVFDRDIDDIINEISNGGTKGNSTKIKISEIRPNLPQLLLREINLCHLLGVFVCRAK